MNKFFTLLVFVSLFAFSANAQVDTLLFENFNEPFDTLVDDSDGVVSFALGNDTIWVNFDEDGIMDANGRPQTWYQSLSGWFDHDSLQGGVLQSSSWLDGFADGNRNWLILPPIALSAGGNANAELSWKSAPFQGPRYMDGYSVRISTTSNDPLAVPYPFTDTVFQACQMVPPLGSDTTVSTFNFSPGYIHANSFTDWRYYTYDAANNAFDGYLEPHTINLSQYAGQTIYIAFVHDADDDNLMAIDDILVMGQAPQVNTQNVTLNAEVKIFPNPVTTNLTLNYNVRQDGDVNVTIMDATGRVVREMNAISTASGQYNENINVADLAAGAYQLVIAQNGKRIAKRFVKQ